MLAKSTFNIHDPRLITLARKFGFDIYRRKKSEGDLQERTEELRVLAAQVRLERVELVGCGLSTSS